MANQKQDERARGAGGWNRVTALASLVIAVATLGVVFYQAHLMRQQTRAATWPFLYVQTSVSANDSNTAEAFRFIVSNAGVGPARLEAVSVAVDGKPVRTWAEAIEALTGGTERRFSYSGIAGYVFAPQSSRDALVIDDPELLKALLPQLRRLSGSLCYCSVLDECTVTRTGDPGTGLDRAKDRVVSDRCAAEREKTQFRN